MWFPGLLAAMLLAVLTVAPRVGAEPLDPESSEALSETLGALRKTRAGKAGTLDPRLGAIEQSPELEREFSELAAAIMTELATRYGGDPDGMAAAAARGKTDPEGFAAMLSPATRAKLESLSRKLESERR
jgi:hypothetical protein